MRALVMSTLVVAACGDNAAPPPRAAAIDAACVGTADAPRVLVFSRETLWMHPSTPVAQAALIAMCGTHGFSVTASRDPAVFDATRLAEVDVVVFAVTSGNVLDPRGREAFEAWVRAGGGVVGIHSASATEYDWPFFVDLIGAQFRTHPAELIEANVTNEAPSSPITAGLPSVWPRTDEWYVFHTRPEESRLQIVLALDESSALPPVPADLQVGYHPIAWTNEKQGGRMFYTAMGHTPESYAEPSFLDLIANAIVWADGRGLAH
ncbi:MAG: ThuA domain-containing protein [Kofleriaceae bacterium]